ncbi:MAG: OsmC family protein [Deltaproteobacteria bacterium]|nr:OsmC family protein [Deltaproteobacteria bacterium]
MQSEMEIMFPGGKKVDAYYNGFLVKTDQPVGEGGEASAPEPYTLFLASIGTCVGIYVKSFCDHRGIPTDRVRVVQRMRYDVDLRRLAQVEILVHVPPEFPKKYRAAIARAAGQCAVKRAMFDPPEFLVETRVASVENRA